ncbi:hypothetical protein ElyMa_004830700 [Elysia marginata]|uniref:Uncharacterized protein n=1 Tax=Elysia marginata TaxID=1093978 RepID=A0AAV4INK8_9GAST|nr:hypothetical protein ElyMa_004830700 [Elysia marginata]
MSRGQVSSSSVYPGTGTGRLPSRTYTVTAQRDVDLRGEPVFTVCVVPASVTVDVLRNAIPRSRSRISGGTSTLQEDSPVSGLDSAGLVTTLVDIHSGISTCGIDASGRGEAVYEQRNCLQSTGDYENQFYYKSSSSSGNSGTGSENEQLQHSSGSRQCSYIADKVATGHTTNAVANKFFATSGQRVSADERFPSQLGLGANPTSSVDYQASSSYCMSSCKSEFAAPTLEKRPAHKTYPMAMSCRDEENRRETNKVHEQASTQVYNYYGITLYGCMGLATKKMQYGLKYQKNS